jgi:hypothetical protein
MSMHASVLLLKYKATGRPRVCYSVSAKAQQWPGPRVSAGSERATSHIFSYRFGAGYQDE